MSFFAKNKLKLRFQHRTVFSIVSETSIYDESSFTLRNEGRFVLFLRSAIWWRRKTCEFGLSEISSSLERFSIVHFQNIKTQVEVKLKQKTNFLSCRSIDFEGWIYFWIGVLSTKTRIIHFHFLDRTCSFQRKWFINRKILCSTMVGFDWWWEYWFQRFLFSGSWSVVRFFWPNDHRIE